MTTTPANSTNDPRIVWEDGQWAIIEARHYPPGIGRSKSRDQLGDAVAAHWEPTLITAPGAKAIASGQLVKVRMAEFWAVSPVGTGGVAKIIGKGLLNPGDFAQPVAPPSPFMPKPWKGKDIPDYPAKCPRCGGMGVILPISGLIHEATDPKHNRGDGRCPPAPVTASTAIRRVRP